MRVECHKVGHRVPGWGRGEGVSQILTKNTGDRFVVSLITGRHCDLVDEDRAVVRACPQCWGVVLV